MSTPPRVFLTFQGAAGEILHIQLPRAEPCATTYLPNECENGIALSCLRSDSNSLVRIQIFPHYLLLSAWDSETVSVLTCTGDMIDLPMSTIGDQSSFILLDGSQFSAPSGRWTVQFDLDYPIANSMNPPAKPVAAAAKHEFIKQGLQEIGLPDPSHDHHEHSCAIEESDNEAPHIGHEKAHQLHPSRLKSFSKSSQHDEQSQCRLELSEREGMKSSIAQNDGERPESTSINHSHVSSSNAGEESQYIPQEKLTDNHRHVTAQSGSADPGHQLLNELHEIEDSVHLHVLQGAGTKGAPRQILAGGSQITPRKRAVSQDSVNVEIHGLKPIDTCQNESSTCHTTTTVRPIREAARFPTPQPGEKESPNKKRKILHEKDTNTTKMEQPASAKADRLRERTATCSGLRSSPTSSGMDGKEVRLDTITVDVPKVSLTKTDVPPNKVHAVITPRKASADRESASGNDNSLSRLPRNPSILFSKSCTIQQKKNNMRSFMGLGGKIVDNIVDADILCVPAGGLKKTPKLILAIVLGKLIVTEEWIVQTHRQNAFPNPATYIPKDKAKEEQWGFRMVDAIKRSRVLGGENFKLISKWNVYITPQLQRTLSELLDDFQEIASAMGASKVHMRLPSAKARQTQILVLGCDNDADALAVKKLGYVLHSKDILTMAALRGKLEADSEEFQLDSPIKEEDSQG